MLQEVAVDYNQIFVRVSEFQMNLPFYRMLFFFFTRSVVVSFLHGPISTETDCSPSILLLSLRIMCSAVHIWVQTKRRGSRVAQ